MLLTFVEDFFSTGSALFLAPDFFWIGPVLFPASDFFGSSFFAADGLVESVLLDFVF